MFFIFSSALSISLPVFIYVIFGYIFRQRKIIGEEFSIMLSKLLLNLLVPALIFYTIVKFVSIKNISEGGFWMLLGLGVLIISFFLTTYLSKMFSKNPIKRGAYIFALVFPNFGFMGLPILSSLFGDSILMSWAMFTIPYYILINTLGLYVLSDHGDKKLSLQPIFNNITYSIIIGLVVSLLNIPVHPVILNVLKMSYDCVTPLSMILAGFVLGSSSLKLMFLDWGIYLISAFRLIILPLILMFILIQFGFRGQVLAMPVLITAMPVAVNGVMLAEAIGTDSESCALSTFISTLLSLITIPFMASILSFFK